jgi:hypothetical protein
MRGSDESVRLQPLNAYAANVTPKTDRYGIVILKSYAVVVLRR